MKIRVSVTLNVDVNAWAELNGIADHQVRDDVRDAVKYHVLMHYRDLGVLEDD